MDKYFTIEDSLKAVRRNGMELKNVKEQTEEICLKLYVKRIIFK